MAEIEETREFCLVTATSDDLDPKRMAEYAALSPEDVQKLNKTIRRLVNDLKRQFGERYPSRYAQLLAVELANMLLSGDDCEYVLAVVNKWLLAQAMQGCREGVLQLVCMERARVEDMQGIGQRPTAH